MSCCNDLTQSLRKRGCEEAQVLDVLEHVRETAETTRLEPDQEFGSPDVCASHYTGPRRRSPGPTTLNVFGALGLICVAVYAVRSDLFGFTTPVIKQFAGMIAMLVLLILGDFAAAFVDTRLPRQFGLNSGDSRPGSGGSRPSSRGSSPGSGGSRQ